MIFQLIDYRVNSNNCSTSIADTHNIILMLISGSILYSLLRWFIHCNVNVFGNVVTKNNRLVSAELQDSYECCLKYYIKPKCTVFSTYIWENFVVCCSILHKAITYTQSFIEWSFSFFAETSWREHVNFEKFWTVWASFCWTLLY